MSIKQRSWTKPRLMASAGLVTAGLAGGAILGTTLSANAATNSTSATSAATSTGTGTSSTAPPSMPSHGSAAHEDAETAVTGAAATKAQAAAVKYVGSGTAGAVTTDYTKNGYEVTVTKADRTQVEVHLDSSFNVMQGGPGHCGGPDGNNAGNPPAPSRTAG